MKESTYLPFSIPSFCPTLLSTSALNEQDSDAEWRPVTDLGVMERCPFTSFPPEHFKCHLVGENGPLPNSRCPFWKTPASSKDHSFSALLRAHWEPTGAEPEIVVPDLQTIMTPWNWIWWAQEPQKSPGHVWTAPACCHTFPIHWRDWRCIPDLSISLVLWPLLIPPNPLAELWD